MAVDLDVVIVGFGPGDAVAASRVLPEGHALAARFSLERCHQAIRGGRRLRIGRRHETLGRREGVVGV